MMAKLGGGIKKGIVGKKENRNEMKCHENPNKISYISKNEFQQTSI